MRSNKPAHIIQVGRIRAVIWVNSANGRAWFNVAIHRLFQHESGEVKEATSFGREDLPIVSKLADMAFAWIWSQQSATPVEIETTAEGRTSDEPTR